MEKHFAEHYEPEIVFSRSVKAGRRIYYMDVKRAKNEDLYVCITESKKSVPGENQPPVFEKHKVFLYKEDFARFLESLNEVVDFVRQEVGEIEDRPEWVPGEQPAADAPMQEEVAPVQDAEPRAVSDSEVEERKHGGLLGFLRK